MSTHDSSSSSPYTPWSGFVLGVIGGFTLSAGLIGLAIGYSLSMGGGGMYAGVPSPSPAAPAAPAPAAAPAAAAPDKPVRIADAKTDHIRGKANAAVTIIEYSDFECPFCKRHHDTLKAIAEKYPNDVNIVYRHFPLAFHPSAQKAAEGSECAAELGGNDGFWKYHDALFGLAQVSLDQLVPTAKAVGLDEAKFKTCLDSGKFAQKVKDQMDEGISFGVQGTPGNFVINNKTKEQKELSGAVPAASFEGIINPMLGK